MTAVQPGATRYVKGDPITHDLRQVAAAIRQAYRGAHTTEQWVTLHRCATEISYHVFRWGTAADQDTLHRRWMLACLGDTGLGDLAAKAEPVAAPVDVDAHAITKRLQRAGEVAARINEAARGERR